MLYENTTGGGIKFEWGQVKVRKNFVDILSHFGILSWAAGSCKSGWVSLGFSGRGKIVRPKTIFSPESCAF